MKGLSHTQKTSYSRYPRGSNLVILPPNHHVHLFIAALLIIRSSRSLLSRLLLLVLILGLGLLGQRLLQDLENFLVRDLFVSLQLRKI